MKSDKFVAALAAAFAASAAAAQALPEEGPVKRPDGSVVRPGTESLATPVRSLPEQGPVKRPDGSVVYPPVDAGVAAVPYGKATAEERERNRKASQESAQERIEQSRREREAALANPARQVPPTVNR